MAAADCLVDTDVFVDFFRGKALAVAFVREHAERIVLSTIVLAELYASVREDSELAQLDCLEDLFPVKSVDTEIARMGGLLKQKYGKSHGVGLADALLAATVRRYGLVLKTLNVRHYPMFTGLEPAYVDEGRVG